MFGAGIHPGCLEAVKLVSDIADAIAPWCKGCSLWSITRSQSSSGDSSIMYKTSDLWVIQKTITDILNKEGSTPKFTVEEAAALSCIQEPSWRDEGKETYGWKRCRNKRESSTTLIEKQRYNCHSPAVTVTDAKLLDLRVSSSLVWSHSSLGPQCFIRSKVPLLRATHLQTLL